MGRFRTLLLAKAVVAVLLIWTALDLADAGLCAAEQAFSRSVASGHVLVSGSGQTTPDANRPAIHVDDCFCCSQCVRASWPAPVADVAVRTAVWDALVPAAPRLRSFPFYHPPRLLA